MKLYFNGAIEIAILLLAAGLACAQIPVMEPAYPRPETILQHPERVSVLQEIEGRVQAVDVQNRYMTIKDALDREYRIQIGVDTPVSDIDHVFMKLAEIKSDDRVRIIYTTFDMTAR